jgi:protein-S-isoprenylcysteine O-methyltransferase Ste14
VELFPKLGLGWLNGWLPLGFLYLILGIVLAIFPKDVVRRLYDKSGWRPRPRILRFTGRLLALVLFGLLIFTPLKVGDYVLIPGGILFALGLAGFAIALFSFRDTPFDQPVVRGLYRVSRNPQIVALSISLLGICIATGSWVTTFLLVVTQSFSHARILAEEKSCLEQYGDSYRSYMKRVPRYFLFR